MKNDPLLMELLRGTRIIKPPKHALATFGTTTLRYVLLSALPGQPGCCRMRRGEVTAERPKILTPDLWKKRFEGFGEEAAAYQEQIEQLYGESLRALEYRFRNELQTSSVEHASLPEVADRTAKMMDDENALRTTLLEGPDQRWSFSIMKFIVEMSLRSFPANVRELEERGLFDPEKQREKRLRLEIERLFEQSSRDRSAVERLGAMLKETGLFSDYEDRFFALIRR
jgi:hypothetical protein